MRSFVRGALFIVGVLGSTCLPAQDVTTFIVVRHAEKANDGTKDPPLTEAGKARAVALREHLSKQPVRAIWSTDFQRTRQTVQPLAEDRGLVVQVYAGLTETQVRQWVEQFRGGTVVVCGHSNTVPVLIQLLTGGERLPDLTDDDYGNLFVLTVMEPGRGSAVRLTY